MLAKEAQAIYTEGTNFIIMPGISNLNTSFKVKTRSQVTACRCRYLFRKDIGRGKLDTQNKRRV